MICPLDIPENAQVLIDYGAGKLDSERTATLERHMEHCLSCRQFVAEQRALCEAMDSWEAPPVSRDFDRRLYARIEQEVSVWEMLARPFRPLFVRRGLPVAAAACLVVLAGALIDQPPGSQALPPKDTAQMESVQPEQVEQALDAMEMLSEFSHHVRRDGQESKL
uniref:Putative transmembrane anti-sigma factor n=1 Tax=Solibacter usitatus (strain Ellin6076) TaxID=234267 RepID=Q02C93_SOLUE